jgi:hypothetical protein
MVPPITAYPAVMVGFFFGKNRKRRFLLFVLCQAGDGGSSRLSVSPTPFDGALVLEPAMRRTVLSTNFGFCPPSSPLFEQLSAIQKSEGFEIQSKISIGRRL